MADLRRVRVWGLVAEQARIRRAPVSAADCCGAAAAVSGTDGAWLTVMSGTTRRELVYATGKQAAELEELQFTVGEGPCVDTFGSGTPVLAADLRAAGWRARWPGFMMADGHAGAAALFALPLTQGAIRVGVLGLYRATPGPLTPEQLADVLVCADAALLLLLSSRAGADGDERTDVDSWPGHRAQVYQATGMVSVQRGVSLEEALALLRAYSFAHSRPLGDVAAEIVARRLRLDSGDAGDPAG